MNRLPALPVILIVAIVATIVSVLIQGLIGKSAATIATGPLTAIALAIVVSQLRRRRR